MSCILVPIVLGIIGAGLFWLVRAAFRKPSGETSEQWHARMNAEHEAEQVAEAVKIGVPTHTIEIDGVRMNAVQSGHSFYLLENGAAIRVAPFHSTTIVGFPRHTKEEKEARAILLPLFAAMIASPHTEPYTHNLGMGLTSLAVRYIGEHGQRGAHGYFFGDELKVYGLSDVPPMCQITTKERADFEADIKAKSWEEKTISKDELLTLLP